MITRRMFVGALAGVCAARERLVLEAIAAERMPHRLIVSGVARSAFFEVRNYGSAALPAAGLLSRHGIRPVREERGKLLFAFDSLGSREQSWRGVSGDAEWIALQKSAVLKEISIYRTASL